MTREGSIPQVAVKTTLGCKCRIRTANSLAAKPRMKYSYTKKIVNLCFLTNFSTVRKIPIFEKV